MEELKPINVFITPHYHYDFLWCDTQDGMGAKTAKIIKQALLIMRRHPTYKYVIDSVMSVEYFKLHHPGMMDELKKRVKEGRIELMGRSIIAPDQLMPNGESLVRQFLYGHQYFKTHFGIESKTAYFLDSFGQTPQLPQILRKAGFENLIFWRGAGNRRLPSEFFWKAFDGSTIFTHWLSGSYTWITLPFTGTILPPVFPFMAIPFTLNIIPQNFRVYEILKKLFPPIKWLVEKLNALKIGVSILGADMSAGLPFTIENRYTKATTNNVFILNGTDNIPPSTNIIDAVDYLQKKSRRYNVLIATPSEFLNAVKSSRKTFGVVQPHEFSSFESKFPGTYSTRIRLKQKIRLLETLFYKAELMASLANLKANLAYPMEELTKAIIRILCCDFHDAIPGCHVDACYEDLMNQLRLSQLQLERISDQALTSLGEIIDTSRFPKQAIPLLVFNPISDIRTELVGFKAPTDVKTFSIRDFEGNVIPYQQDSLCPTSDSYLLKANEIPSIGYKTFYIESSGSNQREPSTELFNFSCEGDLTEIKTERFTLTFESNKLRTIADQKTGLTIEASRYFINDLRILNDRGDSYLLGKKPKKNYTTYDNQLDVIEKGPLRVVIRIVSKLQCKNKWFIKRINEITQYIILYNFDIPRIDFMTAFKNKIRNIRIEACFPVNFKDATFHSEVPYGFMERDTVPKYGGWEDFKKNFAYYDRVFPVINWMDVSDKNSNNGFCLFNNGLPAHEISSNKDALFLTLMRSTGYVATLLPGAVPMVLGPFYNIPKAYELADQEFHYSLYFHDADISRKNLSVEALKHNIPLISKQIRNDKGNISPSESFISVQPRNFVISSVKHPEIGENAMIIRILETSNKPSNGVIKINSKINKVFLVNLLEENIEEINPTDQNSFSFSAKQQEIVTFKIQF